MTDERFPDDEINLETRKVDEPATDLVTQAKALTVTNPAQAEYVGRCLVQVKGFLKRVHAWIDPTVDSSYETWQKALKMRKDLTGPPEEAEKIYKRKLADYDLEEERKRKEAQERLDAERRKKEEAERERLRKENERLQAEARVKEEKIRKQQEEAEAKERERRRIVEEKEEAKRREAIAKGQAEEAKRLQAEAEERAKRAEEDSRRRKEEADARADEVRLQAEENARRITEEASAVHVPQAIAEKETPRMDGVQMSDNWKYEVINEALVPRDYLMLDTKKIGAVGRATKGSVAIPGIKFYNDKTVAVNSGTRK